MSVETRSGAPSRRHSSWSPPISRADWGGRATRAEINLDALAANVHQLREAIGPASLIAVLKADAYGHGAATVAHSVAAAGASMVATYTVQEAASLRHSGLALPILTFGPIEPGEIPLYGHLGLTATVWDRETATLLDTCSDDRVDVHIEIDTGLHRAGVDEDNAVELAQHIDSLERLQLAGVFTHFSSADEPEAMHTGDQLNRFLSIISAIEAAGIPVPLKHASNSGGALYHRNTHLNAVRCGIALYGYSPNPGMAPEVPLRPVMSLLSRVIRLHVARPGDGVGYGQDFRPTRPTRIALVPIGYGDGLHRSLGNGNGTVLISGRPAPIVGRVSMDQITVDVTHIDGVRVGSDVVILGRSVDTFQDAHDLGRQAGTVCYEVLTSVSPRVPRLYVQQGQMLGER